MGGGAVLFLSLCQFVLQNIELLVVSAARLTSSLSFLNTGTNPRNVPRFGSQCDNKCCVSHFSLQPCVPDIESS